MVATLPQDNDQMPYLPFAPLSRLMLDALDDLGVFEFMRACEADDDTDYDSHLYDHR